MTSNFSFLPPAFKDLAEAARKAEAQITGDPRAACFHARFAELDALFAALQHRAFRGEL